MISEKIGESGIQNILYSIMGEKFKMVILPANGSIALSLGAASHLAHFFVVRATNYKEFLVPAMYNVQPIDLGGAATGITASYDYTTYVITVTNTNANSYWVGAYII